MKSDWMSLLSWAWIADALFYSGLNHSELFNFVLFFLFSTVNVHWNLYQTRYWWSDKSHFTLKLLFSPHHHHTALLVCVQKVVRLSNTTAIFDLPLWSLLILSSLMVHFNILEKTWMHEVRYVYRKQKNTMCFTASWTWTFCTSSCKVLHSF